MKTILTYALIALAMGAVLFGVVSCKTWQYGECKKVGHGDAYCAYDAMRG